MAELFLDPSIRSWVFLPLVIITFLFGVLRHYMTIMFTSEKKGELENIGDSHALIRSRLLRENGRFLPAKAFKMRKYFFNDKEHGFFKTQKRESPMNNPMADPSMATEMLRSNALNMVPMIVIGSWINWAFSGFLTTKVPFPLTYRFKPMLQRGCESLTSLDASWVSSASWYFLNIFGLRSMYGLVLGSDNAADNSMILPDHQVPTPQAPQDMQKAFKAEWEALEVVDHHWALADCETRLLNRLS
ncbi:unnamed protein product [Schistosoma guineensis]|uniref:ER membrane protein complex subunit 3 n=6 Tax=Schistosoma TaxID=6181 RepID=A0A183MI94_9TREM|nr:unnamed protein product [Schistosoma mattheei]CAH8525683.1 unnamed protein product [Schistosoma intercalatum]CAH8533470.1 unnamed protein product [Schistosoma guineensis]CAH8535423.1 unnamed protein product [Schistosoma margrebowiei]CAH8535831.1 unnamed protein product [Schistosoma bovis]CAH8537804.1 unnamed protein product [Schistosoma curassoni]